MLRSFFSRLSFFQLIQAFQPMEIQRAGQEKWISINLLLNVFQFETDLKAILIEL